MAEYRGALIGTTISYKFNLCGELRINEMMYNDK